MIVDRKDYEPDYYRYAEWIDCPICGYTHREDYNCRTGKRETPMDVKEK